MWISICKLCVYFVGSFIPTQLTTTDWWFWVCLIHRYRQAVITGWQVSMENKHAPINLLNQYNKKNMFVLRIFRWHQWLIMNSTPKMVNLLNDRSMVFLVCWIQNGLSSQYSINTVNCFGLLGLTGRGLRTSVYSLDLDLCRSLMPAWRCLLSYVSVKCVMPTLCSRHLHLWHLCMCRPTS